MKIPSLPFELKGTSFTIPAIYLQSSDMEIISAHLAAKVKEAATFFNNAPVVIDLGRIVDNNYPALDRMVYLLKEHGFMPVGLSGGSEEYNQMASAMGLALLTSVSAGKDRQKSGEVQAEEVSEQKNNNCSGNEMPESPVEQEKTIRSRESGQQKAAAQAVANRIITTPIRSGQRVVVSHGDLIITASVGSGAEIIAAGNIHVYGTLRGRAIAGSRGDENARIFCKRLDADLISIAGIYQVNEDFPREISSAPVQIRLDGERLVMSET